VAVGTDANFAELNRNRPPAGTAEMLCFAANPQVHARDGRSIVESLESLPDLLRTASSFSDGAPVAVTPVTLKPRFNAVATDKTDAPPRADPRQQELFAAAWTLGHVAQLAIGGAVSATYYETLGVRGIADADGVFPVYHVFADLGELRAHVCRVLEAPRARAAFGLHFEFEAGESVLIANPGREPVCVDLSALPGFDRVRMLDATAKDRAMKTLDAWRASFVPINEGALTLAPSAYARLEKGYRKPDHCLRFTIQR
jgi:hypothetical protein